MLKRFIERPVLSTVVSIILTLLGLLSLYSLPITLFPDIAPPTVQVTASYPGANAEVVARAVATPIEEAINGVEDMTYMTSHQAMMVRWRSMYFLKWVLIQTWPQ
jgi:HAE1 family hydrophobic/amphiphilic exporter-1